VLYRLATRREYERHKRAAVTLQQQQGQGEGHRCNEMMPEEHQQQIEVSSEHNGGVERSDANGSVERSSLFFLPYPRFISKLNCHFWLGWLDVDNMKAYDVLVQ